MRPCLKERREPGGPSYWLLGPLDHSGHPQTPPLDVSWLLQLEPSAQTCSPFLLSREQAAPNAVSGTFEQQWRWVHRLAVGVLGAVRVQAGADARTASPPFPAS